MNPEKTEAMTALRKLMHLTQEDTDGRWRITLEYDNYQDGAILRLPNGKILSECYILPEEIQKDLDKHIDGGDYPDTVIEAQFEAAINLAFEKI